MKKKFEHIELLRFFSAFVVVITHYIHFFNPFLKDSTLIIYKNYLDLEGKYLPFYSFLENFYRFGYVGVYFFWLISGFVLAYTYLNNEKYKISFKNFFINRFARLYPLHLLTLFLVIFIQFFLKIESGYHQIIGHNMYNGENNLENLFMHTFFMSGWMKVSKFSYNFPIWSVSIEIVIYFLFFFSLRLLYKFRLPLSFLFFIFFLYLEKSNINLFFDSCGRYFFSGVFLLVLSEKIKNLKYILLLALILLFLNFIGNFKYNVFFASLVLFAYYFDHSTNYKLSKNYSKLGNLTYGSYLLHIPIQLLIIFIFYKFQLNSHIFTNYYFLLIYVTLIFSLAHISFKFYENPAKIFLKKNLLNFKKRLD